MMRIRLSVRRAVLFLALFAFALVAMFPMRIVLGGLGFDRAGLSVREVQGSVWNARLLETRFGAASLGDLNAGLKLFPLFVGRASVDLSRPGDDATAALKGAIGVTRHTLGMEGVTVRLPTGTTFAPMPIVALDLNDVSVRYRDGRCERAVGLVRAEIRAETAGVVLPAALSGTARCDNGSLLLPLASQSGMEALALRIGRQGAYTADLTVRPSDPATQRTLQAIGFAVSGDGLKLSVAGTL